jgi:sec-independent protein translocase protein TatA
MDASRAAVTGQPCAAWCSPADSVLTEPGMGSFSIWHWMVVIIVLLLVFGPKRFADAAKGLGQALRGFKEELGKGDEESHQTGDTAKRLPEHDQSAPSGSPSGTPAKRDGEGHDGRPV